jgi:hypothetical protein
VGSRRAPLGALRGGSRISDKSHNFYPYFTGRASGHLLVDGRVGSTRASWTTYGLAVCCLLTCVRDRDEKIGMEQHLLTGLSLNATAGTHIRSDVELVSSTRWWVLGSFSALSLVQAVTWNFYAPVHYAVQGMYNWDASTVAWIENTANVAMLVSIPFSQICVDSFGNRVPTLCCAAMMVTCTGLRCVPSLAFLVGGWNLSSDAVLAIDVVSMVFNGAAAAWLNFAPPILSATWFPTHERATATALMSIMPCKSPAWCNSYIMIEPFPNYTVAGSATRLILQFDCDRYRCLHRICHGSTSRDRIGLPCTLCRRR